MRSAPVPKLSPARPALTPLLSAALVAAALTAGCAPQPRGDQSAGTAAGFELFDGPFREGGTVFYHDKPSRAGLPPAPHLETTYPGALLWVFAFTETGSASFSRRVEIARRVAASDPDCDPIPVPDSDVAGQGAQPAGIARYVMLPVLCRY